MAGRCIADVQSRYRMKPERVSFRLSTNGVLVVMCKAITFGARSRHPHLGSRASKD